MLFGERSAPAVQEGNLPVGVAEDEVDEIGIARAWNDDAVAGIGQPRWKGECAVAKLEDAVRLLEHDGIRADAVCAYEPSALGGRRSTLRDVADSRGSRDAGYDLRHLFDRG